MRKVSIIVSGMFAVLCVLGWFMFINQRVSSQRAYDDYIEQGDRWVEDGLFQRAIDSYLLAAEEKVTEEIYVKVVNSFEKRYEEAPKETKEEYVEFLESAILLFPGNECIVDSLIRIYFSEEKYSDVYACILNAIENGYTGEYGLESKRKVQYAFDYRREEFEDIISSADGIYAVKEKGAWSIFGVEEGYIFTNDFQYINVPGEDGILVVRGEDSRLVNMEGTVLAIFNETVQKAGTFAEGAIPLRIDGVYAYYDEFGKKMFGKYQMASMFQNEMAVVNIDGQWCAINQKGEIQTDKYEEIVLDELGRYIVDDLIIVKETEGQYCFLDKDWKEICSINCDNIDIYRESEWIAVEISGKWGFVNSEGEIVIEPTYEAAKSFSCGLAGVCKDGLWGFINPDNEVVIDYQFHEVGYFDGYGLCPVCTDIIDDGEVIQKKWKLIELIIGIVEE